MTNKDMLKADMLDIIFENRNKDYGAYALRRGYDNRLLLSLGIALSIILLLILLSSFGTKKTTAVKKPMNDSVVIRSWDIPKDKPKEPEMPKEKPKPVQPKVDKLVAAVKHTAQIKIVPDKIVIQPEMPPKEDLVEKVISTTPSDGEKDKGIVKTIDKPIGNDGNTGGTGTEKTNGFTPLERNAEYPGGAGALMRFLSNNLATPDELDQGEKKMVRVRFNVDKDGNISDLRIEMSGGDKYDREVIRVCKKMPRWKPAIQNGSNVPVSYVLPVTFIGLEQ
jgi:periplasmic protein TonB